MQKIWLFLKFFHLQAAPFANSGQVIRTIQHIAEFLVYDAIFRALIFPCDSSFWDVFFQWFILFCPLWDFDHTLLNARGSSQGPTPALWWCYDPAAVWNRWWGTTGRPKEDRPKELKRSRLAQNFSVFFWVGGRNWRGLETAPPKFHLGNNRLI